LEINLKEVIMNGNSNVLVRTDQMIKEAEEAMKEAEVAIKLLEVIGESAIRERAELDQAKERIKKIQAFLNAQ
jgi:hypothetical protein